MVFRKEFPGDGHPHPASQRRYRNFPFERRGGLTLWCSALGQQECRQVSHILGRQYRTDNRHSRHLVCAALLNRFLGDHQALSGYQTEHQRHATLFQQDTEMYFSVHRHNNLAPKPLGDHRTWPQDRRDNMACICPPTYPPQIRTKPIPTNAQTVAFTAAGPRRMLEQCFTSDPIPPGKAGQGVRNARFLLPSDGRQRLQNDDVITFAAGLTVVSIPSQVQHPFRIDASIQLQSTIVRHDDIPSCYKALT